MRSLDVWKRLLTLLRKAVSDPNEDQEEEGQLEAVWHDDDEDELSVNLNRTKAAQKHKQDPKERSLRGSEYENRLRAEFESVNRAPDWARLADLGETEAEEDLLRTTYALTSSRHAKLPQTQLSITLMKDANIQDPHGTRAKQVKFHPSAPLLLTAGSDRMLRLFQIDGKENTKLQSVKFPEMPITSAFFTANGQEIVCTGNRSFFYTFDMVSGEISRCKGIRGEWNRVGVVHPTLSHHNGQGIPVASTLKR